MTAGGPGHPVPRRGRRPGRQGRQLPGPARRRRPGRAGRRSTTPKGADELTFLDITASSERPRDHATTWSAAPPSRCSSRSRSAAESARTEDVDALLRAGADKVGVNTAAIARPELIARDRRPVRQPGPGAVASTRAAVPANGTESGFEVTTHGGRRATGLDAVDWARTGPRAGRRRDPAQLDGRRRHQGRLRPRDDPRRPRRGHRAGDRQRRRGRGRALPAGGRRPVPTPCWPRASSTSGPWRSPT